MFRETDQIGPYILIRKLGRGGFGEVWLAERRTKFVTTKVAVKLPLDEQIDHETIKQEATLWEQASGHPNILPIIDADEYDGQVVIVSEFAPDGSLDEWLKKHGKMPVEQAIETTIKILDGLEFLHSRNIIHRDLKPANILLQGNTPRLADFGISRALRTTASSQSSNVSGTFAYMSPEGFDGKRSVQTDVWSVGVNLYQFLTGELPFQQKEPSALIAAIMMREPEPLPDNISLNLKNVVAKALARLPESRYASASEMREDLGRVLSGEAVADSIQSDSRQNLSASKIPLTQKVASNFAQNSQDENETVVRPIPILGRGNQTKRIAKILLYSALFLLLGSIGLGIYLSKNSDSSKKDAANVTQTPLNNNSSISTNANLPNIVVSNINAETPTPIPAPDKPQVQRTITQYVSRKGGDVNRGVKILYGDLDNDGDEDAATTYEEFSETGHYTFILTVFKNNNGVFTYASSEAVSGSGFYPPKSGAFKITGIKAGYIYANFYDDEEAIEGKTPTQYVLKGNKLVEVKK